MHLCAPFNMEEEQQVLLLAWWHPSTQRGSEEVDQLQQVQLPLQHTHTCLQVVENGEVVKPLGGGKP